jgi:CRISPR-associated endonuclease/helicase Cas3
MPRFMNSSDFSDFYAAIHTPAGQQERRTPFSWQERLAAEVIETGKWPESASVPTGCGKTSLLDIAVFSLVCDLYRNDTNRQTPLRTFFVINRRLVVDDVFAHAKKIASRLAEAAEPRSPAGILKDAAAVLNQLHGYAQPLHVCRLRGGLARDPMWPVPPNLPTLCIGTIDQIGSRLLFRSYGCSAEAAPIDAGLVGWDSLFIVDEAHLAQPFLQTVRKVVAYQKSWSVGATRALQLVEMTATASRESAFGLKPEEKTGRIAERIERSKLTKLEVIPDATFEATLAERVEALIAPAQPHPPLVIGIVVNRVASAREIHRLLSKSRHRGAYRVILLTGRSRPFDRERLLRDHIDAIRPERRLHPDTETTPLIVVATQTIEVGADLDFDFLVTEAAPLSALRQRFGRLFRVGLPAVALQEPCALIALRDMSDPGKPDEPSQPDPIYGTTMLEHWRWLEMRLAHSAPVFGEENGSTTYNGVSVCCRWPKESLCSVDFGITAFEADLAADPPMAEAQARAVSLLPTHLDYLVQTSPRPKPDPEIALYLHGPQPPSSDVFLIWRADLLPDRPDTWADIAAETPPLKPETLAIPIYAARTWLTGASTEKLAIADIDVFDQENRGKKCKGPVLLWRGSKNRAKVIAPEEIRPGDTLLLPADYTGCDEFGWHPESNRPVADVRDDVLFAQEKPHLYLQLRFSSPVLARYPDFTQWRERFDTLLLALAEANGRPEEIALVVEFKDTLATDGLAPDFGAQLALLLALPMRAAIPNEPPAEAKPFSAGFLLVGQQRSEGRRRGRRRWNIASLKSEVDEAETMASGEDRPVLLAVHTRHVASQTRQFALSLGLSRKVVRSLILAALAHDLGKGDRRMQLFFYGNSELAFARAGGVPLAKSLFRDEPPPLSQEARYPTGQRHEMLSLKFLELLGIDSRLEKIDPDLVRVLIGTHHGYGRVWPRVCRDAFPISVVQPLTDKPVETTSDTDYHRLESPWMDRWNAVNQRYGYWQTAQLEAILRLSDWFVSANETL